MKIDYCSDLHIECGAVTLPGGEVLVLAGDVAEARSILKDFHSTRALPHAPGSHQSRYYDFFYHECAKYDQVFYVVGNHEHYHGRYDKTNEQLKAMLPSNVTLLECDVVEYKDVVFVGATTWTNANNMDSLTLYHLKYNLNDYRQIRNHFKFAEIYHKITPEFIVGEHVKTINYFNEVLPQYADRQVVMITHHAPSFMSISEQYRDDFHMNGGYASDLSELILDNTQIKVWIHGHVHSTHDYMIGDTRILANPRGYLGHEQCAENFTIKSFEINPKTID